MGAQAPDFQFHLLCCARYRRRLRVLTMYGYLTALCLAFLRQCHGDAVSGTSLRGSAGTQQPELVSAERLEMPDASGGLDHPGPYAEEPDAATAEKPLRANDNWNLSVGNPAAEVSFCSAHGTGYWCLDSTRVRCCKLPDGEGYAKCGSVANSSVCGGHHTVENTTQNTTNDTLQVSWWYGGWHIHRGWHTNSYCQSHHVGRFCVSHHILHCCNDYGHWVECNSAYTHSSWWCWLSSFVAASFAFISRR